MLTQQDAAALESDLAQFCGTENWWRHWTGRITYTDGVKFLAEKAGAFWFMELVASHQTARLRQEEFQIWKLVVDRDKRPTAENSPFVLRNRVVREGGAVTSYMGSVLFERPLQARFRVPVPQIVVRRASAVVTAGGISCGKLHQIYALRVVCYDLA